MDVNNDKTENKNIGVRANGNSGEIGNNGNSGSDGQVGNNGQVGINLAYLNNDLELKMIFDYINRYKNDFSIDEIKAMLLKYNYDADKINLVFRKNEFEVNEV